MRAAQPGLIILRVDLAQNLVDAFNDGDVEALVALMDPEVELHTMRGLRRGHEEARLALAREPGGGAAGAQARPSPRAAGS